MPDTPILSDDDPSFLPSERTLRGRTSSHGERLKAGDVLLGRYTVLSELGEGGMGVVYKCLDSVGGIEVALKCLPPELSHNEAEMEGIRENYAIVAKLHHSAISGLRNLEKDPGFGEYYLVMDLADGEDLSAILRRRRGAPMPVPEALAILRPLASALDYAHGERVLHRDVKPANVKVRPAAMPGGAPRVQLLDFGLAAEIRSSMSRVSRKGHLGSSGTPSYMAPEQWEARSQSPATDQYSLAVVAYQMLSGSLPFESDDPDLLRRAILSRAPDPVRSLPRSANAALLRALAKDPAARFPSCTAFVEAVGRDLSATRGSARRARSVRFRLALAVAALIVAGALGAMLFSPTRGGDDGPGRSGGPPGVTIAPRQEVDSPMKGEDALADGTSRLVEPPTEDPPVASLPTEAPETSPEITSPRIPDELVGGGESTADSLVAEKALMLARLKNNAVAQESFISKYRDRWDEDKFKKWFDVLDTAKKKLESSSAPEHLSEANLAFLEICEAVVWIEGNVPIREGIDEIVRQIAEIRTELDNAEISKFTLATKRDAVDRVHSNAVRLLVRGDYADSQAQFAVAKRRYDEVLTAATTARAAKMAEQSIALAKDAKKRKDWAEVLDKANDALDHAPGNALALALKSEADANLNTIKEKTEVERKKRDAAAAKAARPGKPFSLDLGGDVKIELAPCPLGADSNFWMGKFEVTQEQWERVMNRTHRSGFVGAKKPVDSVSWDECREFIRNLNELPVTKSSGLTFTLPAQWQWELACRAGAPKTEDYCLRHDGVQMTAETLSSVARCGVGWGDGTVSVGSFQPNAWGLFDMHGNVWEWTETAFDGNRIYCGGCFGNTAQACKAGDRHWSRPDYKDTCIGFRLAALLTTE